jgi:hypothetical protein
MAEGHSLFILGSEILVRSFQVSKSNDIYTYPH